MKILKLSAFILATALALGFGATTLSAKSSSDSEASMKCGAGKCGASMKTPKEDVKKDEKCGAGKCGESMKTTEKTMKCGAAMMTPKKTMKCGAGKCGGNK